jgi:hypothetical protein
MHFGALASLDELLSQTGQLCDIMLESIRVSVVKAGGDYRIEQVSRNVVVAYSR